MAGDEAVAGWIANKLRDGKHFTIAPIGAGFLKISREGCATFTLAAIGVTDVIRPNHVLPLFESVERPPEFVVNVSSKAIWTGAAIEIVHEAPAAFGTLGDLVRASREEPVSAYRNPQYAFFEQSFNQHRAVLSVRRIYDRLYELHRKRGLSDVTVVLVDAYDMSAEDLRHARKVYGDFNIALKTTSYGSITTTARTAAESMGAEALKFGELMARLNRR